MMECYCKVEISVRCMKKCGVEAEEKLGEKSKLARCSKLLN